MAVLLTAAFLSAAQQPPTPTPAPPAASAPLSAPPAHGSEAAVAARRQQIAGQAAALLKLATDLKAEVDKTNQDTLSIPVVRKAAEIERLAHAAKDQARSIDGVKADGAR